MASPHLSALLTAEKGEARVFGTPNQRPWEKGEHTCLWFQGPLGSALAGFHLFSYILVPGIEPSGTVPLSHITSPFYFIFYLFILRLGLPGLELVILLF